MPDNKSISLDNLQTFKTKCDGLYATKTELQSGLNGKQDSGNYALQNGTYSEMTVGKATQADNAATATDAEKLGGVLANQYAIVTGTYADMTVGNATNATNADTADSATSAQDSAKLGGVAAASYARTTGTYSGLSVGYATTAGTATTASRATADASGNNIKDTYAKQNGTYPDMTVGNATNATNAVNATKATQDGSGNNIVDTYTKKSAFNLSTAHISSFLSGVSGWGDIYLSGKLGICTFNISLSSRVNAWTDKYIFYWSTIPAMYRPATGTVFGFLSCDSNDAWMQAGICACDSTGVKINGQSHTIDSGKALVGTLVYIAQNSI